MRPFLVLRVPTAEKQFDMDEFEDLTARQKPTLYIKTSEIFALHTLIAKDLEFIAPDREDPIRDVIRELGNVKSAEVELAGAVSQSEILLTLDPKLSKVEGMYPKPTHFIKHVTNNRL